MWPSEFLKYAYKKRQSLRYIGESKPYYLLSFAYKTNENVTLYINQTTNLLEKIERLAYDNLYGDVLLTTEYKNYEEQNGVKIPKQRIDYEFGRVERKLSYDDVRFDLRPDSNDLKIDWIPQDFKQKLFGKATDKEKLSFESIAPNLNLIQIESQNHKVLLAELKDYIGIFEVPAGLALNRQILDEVKVRYPKKAIKLFVTHHHPDHAGGLRAYADLPVSVVSTQGNERFFKKMLQTTHSLSEAQVANTAKITFDFVPLAGEKRFGNELIAYEIGKNTDHTNEHLVYYFPKSKLLWTGDLLFFFENGRLYPAGKRGGSVYELIRSKNLAVERIYTSWPLQSQKPFGTMDDLKKLIEAK